MPHHPLRLILCAAVLSAACARYEAPHTLSDAPRPQSVEYFSLSTADSTVLIEAFIRAKVEAAKPEPSIKTWKFGYLKCFEVDKQTKEADNCQLALPSQNIEVPGHLPSEDLVSTVFKYLSKDDTVKVSEVLQKGVQMMKQRIQERKTADSKDVTLKDLYVHALTCMRDESKANEPAKDSCIFTSEPRDY